MKVKYLKQIDSQRAIIALEIAIRQIDGIITLDKARERMRWLNRAYMNVLSTFND